MSAHVANGGVASPLGNNHTGHSLTNGHLDGAGGGEDDELLLERLKMRPADVDADMREMSRRKRVDAILGSRTFRAELDRLIESGTLEGGHMMMMMNGATAAPALQQHNTADLLGSLSVGSTLGTGVHCVQPIADLRGVDMCHMSKQEKVMRCKLAAMLRLFQLHAWTQDTGCGGGHVTLRISQDQEHFLVNPAQLSYGEMSAATLLKVDMQGCVVTVVSSAAAPTVSTAGDASAAACVVHPAASHLQLSRHCYHQLHAAVHAARPDLRCVAHVQHAAVLAVSGCRAGLLPLTEHACRLGTVSHQLCGDGGDQLTRQLGVYNKVILVANRGALCCGDSVEEVYYLACNLVTACEAQVRMMPLGLDNLVMLDEEQRRAIFDHSRQPLAVSDAQQPHAAASATTACRLGEARFEAAMRVLDNAGFRTGHLYRHHGAARGDQAVAATATHQSDVEYPPAASSYTYDADDLFKYSPMRKMFAGLRSSEHNRWLNSPNAYQKVEILETGTVDPKKITKWVSDDSSAHAGTTIKVDSLQFVPKNTNPKEFKQLQQQIKENRRAGGISAGPQSHILEGVSWDEMADHQMSTTADVTDSSATTDQVVLVGAASKGIIQRNYQHHATVYKAPYAKNPFDKVTDEDLDEYKRTVAMKSRGDSVDTERVCGGETAEYAEHVQLGSDSELPDSRPHHHHHYDTSHHSPGDVMGASGFSPANGDDTDAGQMSAVSHTDQEDVSTSEASKKDKKKKKGLRTPSFLKKRKDKKREKKESLDSSKN